MFDFSGLIFYRRGGQKSDGKPFEDFEARINGAVFPSLQVISQNCLIKKYLFQFSKLDKM